MSFKPQREKLRILEHQPQADRLPGEFTKIVACRPGGNGRNGVAAVLVGIREGEAFQRLAVGVLQLDAERALAGRRDS